MTIFDHDSGRHIEVDVPCFTGPRADCTLLSGYGREVRIDALSAAAPPAGGLISQRETVGKGLEPGRSAWTRTPRQNVGKVVYGDTLQRVVDDLAAHPDSTLAEVTARIERPYGAVNSALTVLVRRGRARQVFGARKKAAKGGRPPSVYALVRQGES